MLLFRSEEAIDRWCAVGNFKRGESLSVDQVWQLSQLWYYNRLRPEYHGRSSAQVAAIFKEMGLVTPFWDMPS
ncbi:MAG: hypothetical protein HZB51_16040 [Chloroflexi bacterium]|nr:hypothetical protein [Chloroflexota bacterium]